MENCTILNTNYLNLTDIKDVEKVLKNMNFEITEPIGEGSYGKVYKIHHVIEKKDFVAKLVEINIDENILLEFTKKEIEILYQENHKNLIKLIFYKTFRNGLLIVMEYAEKGDLYQYVSKSSLDENHFFAIFKEIFNGIKYLHTRKIQHRDLKLENILVMKDDIIKICDFGLAQKIDELHNTYKTTIRYKKADLVGSPHCLSPEAIGNKEAPFGSVDIWSLGCISYHLIFGFYPFEKFNAPNLNKLKDLIVNENIKYDYPKHKSISKECIEMVKLLLEKNPLNRVNCQKIESLPFFISKNKKNDMKFSQKMQKEIINTEKGYDSDKTVNNYVMKGGLKEQKKENIKQNHIVKQQERLKNNNLNRQSYNEFTKELQQKYSDFLKIIPESDALNILEREYMNRIQSQINTYNYPSSESSNKNLIPEKNHNNQKNTNPNNTKNVMINKPFNLFAKR